MREIKFRGKRKSDGKWIYGYLARYVNSHTTTILDSYADEYRVNIETVGQYTGLKDKNDKKIWKGDIVKVEISEYDKIVYYNFEIIWQHNRMRFGLQDSDKKAEGNSWAFTPKNDFEVIGNIYENPELLKDR